MEQLLTDKLVVMQLLQPRPTDETFPQIQQIKIIKWSTIQCVVFQEIILVIKMYSTKATDLWSFWIIC